MSEFSESDYQAYEEDLEFLTETLRECFEATEARYQVVGHLNALFIEIEGLDEYNPDEVSEIAGPVLDELDMDFDEISILPLRH